MAQSNSTPGSLEPSRTAAEWLESVRDAERRGEPLAAFDLAGQGLEQHAGDVELRYRAVLALARSGSTAQAAREFDELGLSAVDSEDVGALHARIQKDFALAASGAERRRLAGVAAAAYLRIRDRSQGYFPAVNAATLTLVAGDAAGARRLARESLDLVAMSGETSYFSAATEAEALLLLGDVAGAGRALDRARALQSHDYGALSTTRRQLRLICNETGIDPRVLSPLAGPAVAHFCGHLMAPPGRAGRFTSICERDVADRMFRAVDSRPVAFAYGSLASGGDILWAEALLSRGCELHVVLPFALEEFVGTSVARAGPGWVARFHRCLGAAASVSYATEDAYLDDDVLYRYCAELAMGLALLRARYVDAEVHQLALWDGTPATEWPAPRPTSPRGGPPATRWSSCPRGAPAARRIRHRQSPPMGDRRGSCSGPGVWSGPCWSATSGDSRSSPMISSRPSPTWSSAALPRCWPATPVTWTTRTPGGTHCSRCSPAHRCAARCALDLQEAMTALDLTGAGLPSHLAFRLSGHVGPVFPIEDPVLGRLSFMGSHVNRTARIEPVTPTGAVYVTEAFAAALEVSGTADIGCDYVGHLPAAKDYGRLRMYRIWRRKPPVSDPPQTSAP